MLNELKVFIRCVELKSISKAARELRISAALASHRILHLEGQVGVRLLDRTTRSLKPTEAGMIFYDHAVAVLEAVEEADSVMAIVSGVPIGRLQVCAPLTLGRRHVAPLIADFRRRNPKIEVRLRLSDRFVDLASESIDVAIQIGRPPETSAITQKLAICDRVLCASPAYLARRPGPRVPQDLLVHDCLLVRYPGIPEFRWRLQTPGGVEILAVAGPFDADDGDVITEWALRGEGIVLKPYWEVAADLRTGRLITVLPDYPPEPAELFLVLPGRQEPPAKVAAFVHTLRGLVDSLPLSPEADKAAATL